MATPSMVTTLLLGQEGRFYESIVGKCLQARKSAVVQLDLCTPVKRMRAVSFRSRQNSEGGRLRFAKGSGSDGSWDEARRVPGE